MAKVSNVNLLPAKASEAVFELKELLKSAGWTVPSSSDGTTYNAAGDQITHGGSGANGMSNQRAWFRIQDPGGAREFTFQRTGATGDTNDHNWRVKYSALDKFVGGAPDATTTPSATDEGVIHGSGTDASPGLVQLFQTAATGLGRWHIVARDDANASGVYAFWAFETAPGGVDCRTAIFCEAIDPNTHAPLVGTRAAPTTGDPDPCFVMASFSTGGDLMQVDTSGAGWGGSTGPLAWFCMNGTNGATEAFVQHKPSGHRGIALDITRQGQGTTGIGVSPYDGKDEALPIWMGRDAGEGSAVGIKGACQFLRHACVNREYPDTVELSSGAYVYVEDVLIPWEDGTTPLT